MYVEEKDILGADKKHEGKRTWKA